MNHRADSPAAFNYQLFAPDNFDPLSLSIQKRTPLRPGVFLDRDGVINRKAPAGHYIRSADQFELLPAVTESVRRLNHAGWPVIIITNQRGVATGSITALDQIHERMLSQFAEAGAIVSAVYVCPHDYSDGCECRKPRPGMLIKAAAEHHLDLASSWMIGDSNSDVQAGKAAGCVTLRICSQDLREDELRPDYQAANLPRAIDLILSQLPTSPEPFLKPASIGLL